MSVINKKYIFSDEDALAHALFYGYTEKVVDETKLDENGNVPLVAGVNEDGSPMYKQVCDEDAITFKETNCVDKLDDDGNPIPQLVPLDVYIANPESPVEYLSKKFDEYVKGWFIAPVEAMGKAQIKAAEQAAQQAVDAALKQAGDVVEGKIETVIE